MGVGEFGNLSVLLRTRSDIERVYRCVVVRLIVFITDG